MASRSVASQRRNQFCGPRTVRPFRLSPLHARDSAKSRSQKLFVALPLEEARLLRRSHFTQRQQQLQRLLAMQFPPQLSTQTERDEPKSRPAREVNGYMTGAAERDEVLWFAPAWPAMMND